MTPEEVREILRMAQLPVSLEKPIGEEEESELGDFVQDEQAESPFDTASSICAARTSRGHSTAARPRTQGDRASLRTIGSSALHAGGGRQRLRRHPRAHPADREQHAEETREAPRGAGLKDAN